MGQPVAHSLSPRLHNAAFAALGLDWISVGFAVADGAAAGAMAGVRALGLAGVSVTMPHKEAVAALVDELEPAARDLGAVNCVVARDGRLLGANTDGEGLVAALARGAGFDPAGQVCLVVGAGGAARAAVLALARAGAAEVVVVNRTAARAETAAALAGAAGRVGRPADAARAALVVEATPVGLAGAAAGAGPNLVPAEALGPGQLAVDLVYAPAETPWLARAEQAGAATLGGLGMLVHQAAGQLARWTGREPPLEAMWAAVNDRSSGPRDG
jgi:shikimate dehydrogenase